MFERGEYGEFFPYETHLTAYNTSHAPGLFPLTEEEAKKKGARWYDFKEEKTTNAEPNEALPMNLAQTTDEVLKKLYACAESGRPFRIVKDELNFHRQMGIALPRVHPTVRREKRMQQLRPMKYYPVTCVQCHTTTKTNLRKGTYQDLLCETCYQDYIANDQALV